jgi:hypothetical protein
VTSLWGQDRLLQLQNSRRRDALAALLASGCRIRRCGFFVVVRVTISFVLMHSLTLEGILHTVLGTGDVVVRWVIIGAQFWSEKSPTDISSLSCVGILHS